MNWKLKTVIKKEVAIKIIRRGRPLQEIHEYTDLPLQRIQQIAQDLFSKKNSR